MFSRAGLFFVLVLAAAVAFVYGKYEFCFHFFVLYLLKSLFFF